MLTEGLKTGAQHTESLRDARKIYLDGALVDDVTVHPAYRNAVGSVAALYDFQSAPENVDLMTFAVPGSGGARANRIWQLPECHADLVERRKALETWTELHGGFLGRAPDHVASCIAGIFMGREVLEAYDPARAKALEDYYHYARDNELYLTYVIINPQADRSKAAHEQADPWLTAGVVDEDAEGLTIRGAKMLATGGVLANEVFVTCIQPLREGEEPYAVSFAVPMNAKGLSILSRKSYEADAVSTFDNPLSSRFDENDALMYFEDVHVPWDRIFVHRSVDMCRAQFHDTPGHIFQNYQAQIRLSVKLRFLVGMARKLAETIGTVTIPSVVEQLGHLAAQANMIETMLSGMEASGTKRGEWYLPNRSMVYSAQVLSQELYPKIVEKIRELAGGSLIMLPSSVEDYTDENLRRIIRTTQCSPAMSPDERTKFLKACWDAVGSEFGSRHTQYEMFYAGAQFVTRGHSFRTYDWENATALVDDLLAGYDISDEVAIA